jgi:CheY-like chemotaxis protein
MTPTKTLLLVEDEGLVRYDLKEGLVAAGFDVTDVAHGAKALSELEADPSRFLGLITDINLGRGPDGWEIARRGRELVPDLPVVYISGHGSADRPSKGVPKKPDPRQAVRDRPAHHGDIHAADRHRRA